MNLSDNIEISVGTRVGRKTVVSKEAVPAKIYGPLAVHKDIVQGKRQTWRITHIASGLRVCGELTLKAAAGIAKDLRDLPEWQDPTIATENPNRDVLSKLANAVIEARAFHTGGGTRSAQVAS